MFLDVFLWLISGRGVGQITPAVSVLVPSYFSPSRSAFFVEMRQRSRQPGHALKLTPETKLALFRNVALGMGLFLQHLDLRQSDKPRGGARMNKIVSYPGAASVVQILHRSGVPAPVAPLASITPLRDGAVNERTREGERETDTRHPLCRRLRRLSVGRSSIVSAVCGAGDERVGG